MEPQSFLHKKVYLFVIIALVGLLVFFIVYSLMKSQQASVETSLNQISPTSEIVITPTEEALVPSVQTPTVSAYSPEMTAKSFYMWYLTFPGNPLKSGAYKTSALLSDYYKNSISEMEEGNPDPKSTDDPILCNENKTKEFSMGEAQYNESRTEANVLIYQSHGTRDIYRVVLTNESGVWKIKDIMCRH